MPATQDEFVPNAPSTGRIGTGAYPWSEGHFDSLHVGGKPVGQDGAITTSETAAINLAGHRAVRWNGAGQVAYADSVSQQPAAGLTRNAANSGENITVWTGGVVNGFSGLTPGSEYYLSTSGGISASPGLGLWQIIGHAISESELLVQIGLAIKT